MSLDPPAPFMETTSPPRPLRDRPRGSKIPDVVLVIDPTMPPVQSNIRKIIEMKFTGDKRPRDQMADFKKIAGSDLLVEELTPEQCGCGDKRSEPQEQEQEQEQEQKDNQKNPIPIPFPLPHTIPIPPFPPPVPVPVKPKQPSTEDKVEGLILALVILALILDDAVGGEADDAAIPPLFEQMIEDLGLSF